MEVLYVAKSQTEGIEKVLGTLGVTRIGRRWFAIATVRDTKWAEKKAKSRAEAEELCDELAEGLAQMFDESPVLRGLRFKAVFGARRA